MFDFSTHAAPIDGWLTPAEGRFLYESATGVPKDQAIVEIGSWKGRSTVCLANGSRDGGSARVYAVDPHIGSSEHQRIYGPTDTFAEFLFNLEWSGIRERVEPVREPSANAVDKVPQEVGLLFVDGAHDFRSIRQDLDLWFPQVSEGGRIAVHDSWQIFGPSLATAIVLLTSRNVKNARIVDTITVFEKAATVTPADRARNAGVLVSRTFLGLVGWIRLRNSRARLARLGLARP